MQKQTNGNKYMCYKKTLTFNCNYAIVYISLYKLKLIVNES